MKKINKNYFIKLSMSCQTRFLRHVSGYRVRDRKGNERLRAVLTGFIVHYSAEIKQQ